MKKVIDFFYTAKIYDIYCGITICDDLEVPGDLVNYPNGLEMLKDKYCEHKGLDSNLFAIDLI